MKIEEMPYGLYAESFDSPHNPNILINGNAGKMFTSEYLDSFNTHPGFVFVGVGVTGHEEVVRQVSLLHRLSCPLLNSAWEMVLMLDQPFGTEEFDTLVIPVRCAAAHLKRGGREM